MSVLNRDLLRFETLLQECNVKPAMATSKISVLAYLQARSDDELEHELKRNLASAMLKLHNDVTAETDWQFVNKVAEIECYAQVYILSRAKLANLLNEAFAQGARSSISHLEI